MQLLTIRGRQILDGFEIRYSANDSEISLA
jgi:hypothetical protein